MSRIEKLVKNTDLKVGDIITDNYMNPSYFLLISNISKDRFNTFIWEITTIYTKYVYSKINTTRTTINLQECFFVFTWEDIRAIPHPQIHQIIRSYYPNHELDINKIVYICSEEVP